MSYREDQHLRAVATEAGRTDLIEAMDRADAALDAASEDAREAYRQYQDFCTRQERRAEESKEIRRQMRDLPAIGEAAISELEKP